VTARFICTKLWKYFASETVDEAAVEAMASILWQSNWQVRPVLAALFNSARFYDDDIIGTQVKSPAQFVVRLCEDLEFTAPPYAAMARATKAIGQDLLYPPNVKGWDGNRAWINANSLLLRYNLPVRLVQASETRKTKMAADAMMDPDAQAPMMEEAMMSEGSDSKPMEDYADAPVIGPSREERTAYLQESRREAMRRIRQLPPEQQRGMRERFRDSRGAERLQVLSELGIDSPEWATPGPVRMFDNLTFDTAGGCIDALQQRFVSVPFSPTQRPELLKILNTRDESMPLRAENIGPQQRIALLRIIASMAEYQLC